MKIKRWFVRKINLSNHGIKNASYETADFGAEYEAEASEEVTSKRVHELAKMDVENSIANFLNEKIQSLPRKPKTNFVRAKHEFESDVQALSEDGHSDFGSEDK